MPVSFGVYDGVTVFSVLSNLADPENVSYLSVS